MLSYIGYIPHITTLEHVVFQALPISLRQLAMLPELASSFKKTPYLIRMQA